MTQPRLIIAVDDMPERYTELSRRLAPFGWAVVTVENPKALSDVLDYSPIPVLAVLLDHDLRPVMMDSPSGLVLPTDYTGLDYARDILAEHNVPVIVTSANQPGAQAIAVVLAEHAVPHRVISCISAVPEDRWIGALAEWATVHDRARGDADLRTAAQIAAWMRRIADESDKIDIPGISESVKEIANTAVRNCADAIERGDWRFG